MSGTRIVTGTAADLWVELSDAAGVAVERREVHEHVVPVVNYAALLERVRGLVALCADVAAVVGVAVECGDDGVLRADYVALDEWAQQWRAARDALNSGSSGAV